MVVLRQQILDKLAKEMCRNYKVDSWQQLKEHWKIQKAQHIPRIYFVEDIERAVSLALSAKQAEVLKIVREVEEGFEGTAVEFCEKHGDGSYTGFKEC